MAIKKIRCIFHPDQTASLAIYPESMSYVCFGCRKHGPLKDLPAEAIAGLDVADFSPRPKENVAESIAYIRSLAIETHRGLQLPCDNRSFYIVWPDNSYYLRRFTDGSEPKYIGPSGHDRPLYRAGTARSSTLVLTEGELNAASIASCYSCNVVSIGGVGNFTQSRLKKYLPEFNRYERIVVLLDDDPAGTLAAIEACAFFKTIGKVVTLRLLRKDMNKVLCDDGEAGIKSAMEMYLR